MKCPVCEEVDLHMTERQGVEIDYCPRCRGVWLDRGELDKIIERANEGMMLHHGNANASDASHRAAPFPQDYARESDSDEYRRDRENQHDKKPRRKSFFNDIFDFD